MNKLEDYLGGAKAIYSDGFTFYEILVEQAIVFAGVDDKVIFFNIYQKRHKKIT